MASHIFESLMDKLFSLSKETSPAKTLTGSRSFLGTSDNLLNNIPLEFYQSLFSGDDLAMNSSQESNTNINKLNSTDQSLVSQVSKFFHSPPIHSHNSLGLFHSYLNQSLESLENQILLAKTGAMSNHLENKICVSEVIDVIASAAKVQMSPLTNCFVNNTKEPSTVEKAIHIADCIDMDSSPIRKIPMVNSSVNISMPEKKNPIMSCSPEVGKTPEKENPTSYSPEVEKTPEMKNPISYSPKVKKTPEKKNPAAIESNSNQESSKVNKSLGKAFPTDATVTKRRKRCRKKKSRPSTNITDNICQNTQESPVPVASPSKHYNCNVSLDKEIFNFSVDVESSPEKTVITMNNTKNSSPTMVVEVTEINHPKLAPQQIFNQELVNRKNKEIQKRSRKWRRRQHKKNNASANQEANQNKEPSPSSPVATLSKRFECDIVCDIVNMPESPDNGVKLLSSFVISVESACEEDDSEWDMGVTESVEDVSDLEFSGLFISNLSAFTINGFASNKRPASPIPSDDDPETYQLKILLRTVNNRWKETTKEIADTPKAPSKVSFAPDDVLVEAVEVETCERKGIWETYALERLRFKKRIDDLESIISPCLKTEHRQQIFKKLYPKLEL